MEDSQDKSAPADFRRNIYALGLVSFFTDISTEMAYPLLPDLLAGLGAGAVSLGLVEGIAEATASLSKAVSGYISDRLGKRKVLIFAGYLLSGLSKPLLGLASFWQLALLFRFSDRMGKGIRTAPRDALLADSSPPEKVGAAFGLHRAMDTMGAVTGPVLAFFLLHWLGWKLSWIFLVAAIPAGLGLVVILSGVRELAPKSRGDRGVDIRFRGFSPGFRRFVLVSGVFSLGHFPAVFLILRCRELGISMEKVTLVYLAYNLVYSLVALPAGSLSDKVGRRRILTLAYLLFSLVFGSAAFASVWWHMVLAFMGYGVFQGIYAGAHRAFIADLEPSCRLASCYGTLHAVTGVCTLPAGLIAGALWNWSSPASAFAFSAFLGLASALMFIALVRPAHVQSSGLSEGA